jgi:YYY domain-containing protein
MKDKHSDKDSVNEQSQGEDGKSESEKILIEDKDSETNSVNEKSESEKIKKPLIWKTLLLFILIILLGAYFRFTGLNWDDGRHLHPDERFLTMVETSLAWPSSIGEYLNERKSPLNPRNVGYEYFTYGTLPTTIVKAAGILIKKTDYDRINLVGRAVSGILDLGSIIFIFLIGRTLYRDNRIAILSSFLFATSVLAIQHAHFFVVDSFAAFFTTLSLYCLSRAQTGGKLVDFLMAGFFFALSMACKVSVFTLFFVIAAISIYRVVIFSDRKKNNKILDILHIIFLTSLVSFVVFRIAMPDAFRGNSLMVPSERWLGNISSIRLEMNGYTDPPYCKQWTGRTPVIYPLKQMFLWGMGPVLALTAWGGWILTGYFVLYKRKFTGLIPFIWIGLLFLHQSTQFVKYMRYFLPLYPFLSLMAAWLLIFLYDRAKKSSGTLWTPVRAKLLIGLVCAFTLLWAFAFTAIYRKPHSRIEASRWIYEHIKAGASLACEHWDDSLPFSFEGKDPAIYKPVEMKWYDEDTEEKLQRAFIWLEETDYIILSSNRLYSSIPLLPLRYPLTVAYYKSLFDGTLGFEKIADFTSYPQLFGFSIPDQSAEESFTVYDHPMVQIFKKTPLYSSKKVTEILGNVNLDNIVMMKPKDASKWKSATFLPEDELKIYRKEGTWAELFNRNSMANKIPVVIWALLIELLGLIAAPYLFIACEGLSDRGYGLSKTLGMLLAAWFIWLLAGFKIISFSSSGIFAVILFIACGSVYLLYRKWQEFKKFLSVNRDVLLVEECIFWLFFTIFLLIRWSNPDLWHGALGGEKPMDFAYFNSVIKSPFFPPYNPWFAGGYINYYYFGFVLIGTLVKLTGIIPSVAYNLAIPTLFAMTATGSFCFVLALSNKDKNKTELKKIFAGICGAIFVCVIGNLGEIKLIIDSIASLGNTSSPSAIYIVKIFHGFFSGILHGKSLPVNNEWWYWNATRLISHPDSEPGPINEFPWFTYLYGDLHAHGMALPLTLLALGLMTSVIRSKNLNVFLLFFLSLTAGALWPTNTWDFPTYSFLSFIALILYYLQKERNFIKSVKKSFIVWAALLLAGYILYIPYHKYYVSGYNTFEIWHGSITYVRDYFFIHGFFLFIIITALINEFFYGRNNNKLLKFFRLILRRLNKIPRVIRFYKYYLKTDVKSYFSQCNLTLLLLLGLIFISVIHPLAGLCIFMSILTFMLSERRTSDPLWQFTLILISMALLMSVLVEFVVLKGDVGRMNTVFKFYLQIWVIFALASARLILLIFEHMEKWKKSWRILWLTAFFMLFTSTLLYPFLSTGAKIRDRFDRTEGKTLDGTAYMNKGVYNFKARNIQLLSDKKAMEWMEDNIKGSPVICEVNTGDLYTWCNRFSIYTGLPSIVGWDWHERQQLSVIPELVSKRILQVKTIYNTPDPWEAYRILRSYDVEYIIIGQLERACSTPEGIAKFEANSGIVWEKLYDNEGIQIYKLINIDMNKMNDIIPLLKRSLPVEDSLSVTVKKEDLTFIPVNAFKGGRGQTPGNFNEPRDIATDRENNIYTVDFRNYRVQKFDVKGNFLMYFGSKGCEHGQFDDPCGISIDEQGNIFVADTWNQRIEKFSSRGKYLLTLEHSFYGPRDVTVDREGNIYVSDTGNSLIKKFDVSGNFLFEFGKDVSLLQPWGITTGREGEIYVGDTGNRAIKVFNSQGKFLRQWELNKEKCSELYLCSSKDGIIVSDSFNGVITKFDRKGNILKELKVSSPTGILENSKGDIIYINRNEDRLVKISF